MNIFSCPKSFSTLKCLCLHFYRINLPYVSIPFDTVLLCIQIPITYTATRWTLLYFPSSTKKDWYHSRAWWKIHKVQFTGAQVMVPYLVQEMDSLSVIMPTVTLIHAQTLVTTTTKWSTEQENNPCWVLQIHTWWGGGVSSHLSHMTRRTDN